MLTVDDVNPTLLIEKPETLRYSSALGELQEKNTTVINKKTVVEMIKRME